MIFSQSILVFFHGPPFELTKLFKNCYAVKKWRYIVKKILVCLLALLVLGCTHTYGNKKVANKELDTKVKCGITKKAEVESIFGKPNKITFTDNNEEIWEYVYSRSDIRKASFIPYLGLFVGGVDTKMSTLTIRFKENGIVKSIGRGHTTGAGGGLQDMNK